jgi:hypothetical protein
MSLKKFIGLSNSGMLQSFVFPRQGRRWQGLVRIGKAYGAARQEPRQAPAMRGVTTMKRQKNFHGLDPRGSPLKEAAATHCLSRAGPAMPMSGGNPRQLGWLLQLALTSGIILLAGGRFI